MFLSYPYSSISKLQRFPSVVANQIDKVMDLLRCVPHRELLFLTVKPDLLLLFDQSVKSFLKLKVLLLLILFLSLEHVLARLLNFSFDPSYVRGFLNVNVLHVHVVVVLASELIDELSCPKGSYLFV